MERTAGVGLRIKAELDRQRVSVRPFQELLQSKHIPGSSYSTVWHYFKGRREPPLEFVRAAAEELNVEESYLLTGRGPRTAAERFAQEQAGRSGDQRDAFADGMRQSIDVDKLFPGMRDLPVLVQLYFWEVWRRYADSFKRDRELTREETEELATDLWRLWLVPLRALGPQRGEAVSSEYVTRYGMAMLQALHSAISEEGMGTPLEKRFPDETAVVQNLPGTDPMELFLLRKGWVDSGWWGRDRTRGLS